MSPPRRFLFPFIARIARRFGEEGFDQISASLAFTTLISLVPLFGLVLAVVGMVPMAANLVDHFDRLLVGYLLPESSARLIAGKLFAYSKKAAEVTWIGLAVLAITAFLLLHTVERAFNHVWRVASPRPLWRRLWLYSVLLCVWPLLLGGLLAAMSYAVTTSLGFFDDTLWIRALLIKGLTLAVLPLFFAFLYHEVPNAPVVWRDALIAGVFSAASFFALQKGFEFYLAKFPSYTKIYGAFAAAPIFLVWVYLSWAMILVGGLVAATLPEFRGGGRPRRRRATKR